MAAGVTPGELRELTDEELHDKLRESKEELFNLRFQMATGQLANNRRLRVVRQEIARVYRVLDRLPERQRRVLILFELEGMSTAEIAALIGARVGTVRVWLYRARAAFLQHHDQIAAADRKWEDAPR